MRSTSLHHVSGEAAALVMFKRFLANLNLFCIILLVSCVLGCGGMSTPPRVVAQNVAFMGDSITNFWPLESYFGSSVPVENFGVPGNTTTQMLARFDTTVLMSKAGVVVILGGTNDIGHGDSFETIVGNIESMAQQAHDAGMAVILCSVLPIGSYFDSTVPKLNEEIVELAQSHGYLYADYYDQMIESPDSDMPNLTLFKEDKEHPNTAGYNVMWSVLKPLLEEDLGSPVG